MEWKAARAYSIDSSKLCDIIRCYQNLPHARYMYTRYSMVLAWIGKFYIALSA